MSGNTSKLQQIAILSVSFLTILVGTALSPALVEIHKAFPEISEQWLQLVLTIPALFLVPVSLLSSSVIQTIGLKRALLAGLALYFIGGVGAGISGSFLQLLCFRGILGIGAGIVGPLAQILIATYFTGDVRVRMTGLAASATYLMGITASWSIGRLVTIGWRMVFAVYGITIFVWVMNAFFLPNPPAESADKEKGLGRKNISALFLALSMCLIEVAFYAFSTNIALFVNHENWGDVAVV